ncbi:MAG TPA: DUF4331 family protein, partial [Candidatus Acidoferrales bacterium]|nr:DUF4331 family protein [Candidatus Acidoferrales bacterium]
MSHHYSGPDFAFPNGDPRLNCTDLFAFPKPGDDGKTILILNSHPSIGVNPKGPTTTVPFSTEALYEMMIDTDGDHVANIVYSVRFAAAGGQLTATVRRIDGAHLERTGRDGAIVIERAPVSTGRDPKITTAGDHRF